MKLGKLTRFALIGAMLAAPACVHAQHPSPEGLGGFGDHMELTGFMALHGKVVKGAPFSAVAVSESTQTLADGNHIVRKTRSNLFRDSSGRVRDEVTLPDFESSASSAPKSVVIIQDPVAGAGYVLDANNKTATSMPGHPGGSNKFDDEMEARKQQEIADGSLKVDDLGMQMVGGVSAQGTRYTKTTAAGKIGNEKAIVSVSERWYSNDLQMVVMSKRSDPRFGDTTYTLTGIQRQEPSALLFAVPSDYTVQQGKPMHHGGPGPQAEPLPPGM